ncbi:MAG TPA: AAA family ATPase [Bryobacteraceae bacterium]|jgi:pilus assembly protein CpaE
MQTLALALVIGDPKLAEDVRSALADLPMRILMDAPRVSHWGEFLDLLQRHSADLVIAELTALGDNWEREVGQVRQSQSAPAVVVLHPTADPQLILRVMRAGANEYLLPPVTEGLKAALERISGERAERSGAHQVGKTVGFLSAKGGCGATTAACHAAANIQKQSGKQVLLADFDLANGIIGFVMKSNSAYSVVDAMANVRRMDLNYWKALVSNGVPGLEVLKSPPIAPGRRQLLPDLHPLLRFARLHYDWIVVDLGRGWGSLAMDALSEVDETYLITTLDVLALHQAKQLCKTLRETGYSHQRIRLVINRVPRHAEVTTAEIESLLDMPVTATLPEDYDALCDSYADGKLLPHDTNIGKKLWELSAKICGVTPTVVKKRGLGLFL